MATPPATDKAPPPENGALAALLSYLVPGLGQIYQGRVAKGVVFFVCVYALFFYGMFLGSWKNVFLVTGGPDPGTRSYGRKGIVKSLLDRPHYSGQFFVGIAAWPAIYQYSTYDPQEDSNPPLHGFQRQPPESELQALQRDSDKTWDLAWVYTLIAGVLNVMIIYDAFAGPAFAVRPSATKQGPPPNAATAPAPGR